MATRMQQRRGTALQWSTANPVLAAGEIGFETDTSKFKIGNGSSTWSALTYFANAADLAAIIDGAPAVLNTLNELAAAMGDDPEFLTTLAGNLATHSTDSTMVHGITDTADLATKTYANTGVSTHNSDTTDVHGIPDTSVLATLSDITDAVNGITGDYSLLAGTGLTWDAELEKLTTDSTISTKEYADTAVGTHNSDTTDVHGIADTSALATTSATASAISTAVSDHSSDTTNIHGISNTANLATTSYADTAVSTAVSALTKSSVGLGNVDNTSDANKPVSTATQTALDLKAPIANPTFTGTVAGVTKSHVGLSNVDNTSDSNKPVSTATQTELDAKLALSGGTMTGALTLSGAPTSDLHAATKLYVDGIAAGINFHQPVVAATSGNLAGTYSNGTNGVGATLTKASNGAIGTIDGASVAVGNRILLRAQTDAKQNGVYTVTAVGSAGAPWVITRATDADNNPSGELATGDFTFVTSGSTNGSKGFILSTTGTITIGTTEINYTQFNASEAIIAGTNIDKTGATISVVSAPTFSGAITASSGVVFSDGTQTLEGVPSRTPIIQKTASYTLSALTERDDLIEMSSSSALTLTIPTDSTLNFPIGTSLDILQTSTGQVTIAGAAGVTVNATPGLKLRTTWSSATLFKRAANTWIVYGDLTA